MEDKLDEVFESFYSRAEINATEIGWEVIREAEQQAKEQILQAFKDELPMLKLAEYSMNGQRCIIDENIGWNRAIETIKDRLEKEL